MQQRDAARPQLSRELLEIAPEIAPADVFEHADADDAIVLAVVLAIVLRVELDARRETAARRGFARATRSCSALSVSPVTETSADSARCNARLPQPQPMSSTR